MGILSLLSLLFMIYSAEALPIGFVSVKDDGENESCSTYCESSFCSVPPLLKYGKYCGLDYTGCPGEAPCDGLDACCQAHDACVQFNGGDLLSQVCNQNFLQCMEAFKDSHVRGFEGSTCSVDEVEGVVYHVIEAALLTRKVLGHP